MEGALEDVGPDGLAEGLDHRRRLEPRGRAHPAPGEPGRAGGQQEGRHVAQLGGRESEGHRRVAPGPLEDGRDEPPALEEPAALRR